MTHAISTLKNIFPLHTESQDRHQKLSQYTILNVIIQMFFLLVEVIYVTNGIILAISKRNTLRPLSIQFLNPSQISVHDSKYHKLCSKKIGSQATWLQNNLPNLDFLYIMLSGTCLATIFLLDSEYSSQPLLLNIQIPHLTLPHHHLPSSNPSYCLVKVALLLCLHAICTWDSSGLHQCKNDTWPGVFKLGHWRPCRLNYLNQSWLTRLK